MVGALEVVPELLERDFTSLVMTMVVVILMVVGLGGLVLVQVAVIVLLLPVVSGVALRCE